MATQAKQLPNPKLGERYVKGRRTIYLSRSRDGKHEGIAHAPDPFRVSSERRLPTSTDLTTGAKSDGGDQKLPRKATGAEGFDKPK